MNNAAPTTDSPDVNASLRGGGRSVEYLDQINKATVAALQSMELRKRYAADGVKAIGSAPEFLTRYTQTERIKWADVVKRSGATVE
jgi:tripartite-type tricarboxylate transporter receptor subunit TctC